MKENNKNIMMLKELNGILSSSRMLCVDTPLKYLVYVEASGAHSYYIVVDKTVSRNTRNARW